MSEIRCRSPAPLCRQRPMRRSIPNGLHAEEAIERTHLALNLALASSRAAAASEPHQPVMPDDDSVGSSDLGVQSGSTNAEGLPVKDDEDTPYEENFRSDGFPAMPPEQGERKIASLSGSVIQPADAIFAATCMSALGPSGPRGPETASSALAQ